LRNANIIKYILPIEYEWQFDLKVTRILFVVDYVVLIAVGDTMDFQTFFQKSRKKNPNPQKRSNHKNRTKVKHKSVKRQCAPGASKLVSYESRLKSSFCKFYGSYNDIVCDYKLPLAHMLDDLFHTIG
jgi:hypothetical protein